MLGPLAGCRGRVFVEKESATQVQVEDHQRGFCDDDKVSIVLIFVFIAVLIFVLSS